MSTSPNPEAALPGDVAAFALRNTAPLLLLPVRIETKFVDDPQAGQQLWVRIYPDQIAIDSHDETLTEAEWSLAQQYWSAPVWSEPPPFVEEPVAHQAWIDAQQAAWIALARALGPERAAYVANVTAPPGFDTWITAASNRHLGTIGGPGPLGTPVQPTPSASPLRATSWEKAPIAQALPTTWLVGLYQGGTLVLSARVNRSGTTLQAGVDPTPATSGSSTTQAAATAGIGWMTDFDQAVQAGMGVKISLSGLTAAEIQAGFDQVVVVGSTGLDARQGRLTLQQLLTAHRYTDGFSLIAQGTPTKNSTDSSAGYSRKPAPGYGDSFSAERQGPLINTAAGAGQLLDGHYLADALGIPRGVVAHTPLADGTDQPDAIAMATLLWPATGGYTIPYMLGYTLDSETFDGLRQFATTVLRARGPIPAFRVGTVAYGVLPVMSIVNPLPLSGIAYGQVPARVASLVQSARGLWLDSLYDPTAANSDPDEAILRVLSTDAGTCNLSAGYSMGPEQMSNFVQYVGIDQRPQWQQFYDEVVTQTAQQLTELRLPQGTAPAAIGTFLQTPTASGLPIAADGDPANLASLTTTAVSQLLQSGTSASPSILDLLAWRAVLLEYASVAAEILGTSLSEPEYLTVGGTSPFVFALTTPIFTPLSGWPSTIWEESLGDYLYRWMTTPGQAPPPFPGLPAMFSCVQTLASRTPAALARLLVETLDVWAYRLDAWWTAVCAGELQAVRQNLASGILLGCYGYVEALKPAPAQGPLSQQQLQTVNQLVPGASDPLAPRADNGGFVYAPSLAHAVTGAVLRNGYLTHLDNPANNEGPAFEIDLSSAKVRSALQLLEGMRQGQHLGALLGYQFEITLLANGLAAYIPSFRSIFPIVANKLTGSGPANQVAASNVVDGAALQQANVNGIPWGGEGLPRLGSSDYQSLLEVLGQLDDLVDAVSDLSVAESVFQVVRGNPTSSGAVLDASSRDQHPPQPEVASTPRAGLDFTQRVISAFEANFALAQSPWSAAQSSSPRASAEPYLEAWLAAILPPPAQVEFAVSFSESGNTTKTVLTLDEVGIAALDLIALTPPPPATNADPLAGTEVAGSQLEQYLLGRCAISGSLIPPGAGSVSVTYGRSDPDLQDAAIIVPELLLLARALAELLGVARPLLPTDLVAPSSQFTAPQYDLAELQSRLSAAQTAYADLIQSLQDALKLTPPGTPELTEVEKATVLIELLLAATSFGDTQAAPVTIDLAAPAGLVAQAQAVLVRLQKRQDDMQADLAAAQQPDASLAAVQTAARDLFGPGFSLLPLTPSTGTMTTYITQIFEAVKAWRAQLPAAQAAVATVIQQMTHVRPAVAQFDYALGLSTMLAGTTIPTLDVAQLPYNPSSPLPWLADTIVGQFPWDPSLQGCCALLLWTPPATSAQLLPSPPAPAGRGICGLAFDEWVEQIPNDAELSAVALHYEEPTARAPQTLLVALPPPGTDAWNAQLLFETVLETISYAKARAVDPDSLQGLGQVLPALYAAYNPDPKLTLSTDLPGVVGIP